MNHRHLQTKKQTQTLQSTGNAQYHQLYRQLVEEFRVAATVAADLLLTHDLDMVQQHIEFARIEIERGGIRRRAGYIVSRIRDNWGPPEEIPTPSSSSTGGDRGGVKRKYAQERSPRWYTDEEFEIFFERPPDLCGADDADDPQEDVTDVHPHA